MENQIQPYVGPRPFEQKDEELFFGRDHEVNDLLSLVIAHQLTLVYAQSGAGKTSLLNAKLIPRLRQEKYEVLPPTRVQGVEYDKASNVYVHNALINWSAGKRDPQQLAPISLADFLKSQPHTVNKVTSNEEWELPRFIFFDQFEELFTFFPHRWKERQEFFEQVREALEKDHLLHVGFVMREDYIAELDPYVSILPGKLRTRCRIKRLDEKAALQAITKPLIKTRRRFADDAAELLVKNLLKIPLKGADGESEVMGQFVEPVQLQVVCQSLWQALKPEEIVITKKHVESFGDVNLALTDFYEKAIARAVGIPGVREGGLRAWFQDKLITADGTRNLVFRRRDSEKVEGLPIAAVDLLKQMQIIREKWRGQARWYELTHDRLIAPIQKSNRDWEGQWVGAVQIRKRLEEKASEWARLDRSSKGLLGEVELLEAERWLASPEAAELTYSEKLRELVQASRAAVEEQQRRAAERARAAKRLRWLTASLMVVCVAAIALALIAFFKSRQAKASEETAHKALDSLKKETAGRQSAEAVTASLKEKANIFKQEATILRTDLEADELEMQHVHAGALDKFRELIKHYQNAQEGLRQELPNATDEEKELFKQYRLGEANTYMNMGNIYYKDSTRNTLSSESKARALKQAIYHYEKAREIKVDVLGENHQDVAPVFKALADAYHDFHDDTKAMTLIKQVISIYKSKTGFPSTRPPLSDALETLSKIQNKMP
jgi:hypothetical protein